MIQCMACKGRKTRPTREVQFADGETLWNVELPCDRCDMTGEVDERMPEWILAGHKLRAKRVHSPDGMVGLTEFAAKLGIDALTLSRMERGIEDPTSALEACK